MVILEIANMMMMMLLLTLLAWGVVASLKWRMESVGCLSFVYVNQAGKSCSLKTRGVSNNLDSFPCLVRVRAGNLLPDSLE